MDVYWLVLSFLCMHRDGNGTFETDEFMDQCYVLRIINEPIVAGITHGMFGPTIWAVVTSMFLCSLSRAAFSR